MTNASANYTFMDYIQQGSTCQSNLFEVYKNSIGLINDLKNRSKNYMTLLSDIEDGLMGNTDSDIDIDTNLIKLTNSINSFNLEIGEKCNSFVKYFDQMVEVYDKAISMYEAKEGQLTRLIEKRKQILFLKALIRKYKFKISRLQLMNNALLTLSNDLEDAKDAYKSNLIQLSTAMTSAIEDAEELLESIDNVISSK